MNEKLFLTTTLSDTQHFPTQWEEKNFIHELNISNRCFSNQVDISKALVLHFIKLYNFGHSFNGYGLKILASGTLTSFLQARLIALISYEQIKGVVGEAPLNSSPSSTGFTLEFFNKSWRIIGESLYRGIKHFSLPCKFLRITKVIGIVLIPKQSHASQIFDYMKISLCNAFYKIKAKILVNRIKEVMTFLVHPSQAGFIKGRISTYNVILANEISNEFLK